MRLLSSVALSLLCVTILWFMDMNQNTYLYAKGNSHFLLANLSITAPSQTLIMAANFFLFFVGKENVLNRLFFITSAIIFIFGVLLYSAPPSPDANFGYGFYLFGSVFLAGIYATHALWSVYTHRKQS